MIVQIGKNRAGEVTKSVCATPDIQSSVPETPAMIGKETVMAHMKNVLAQTTAKTVRNRRKRNRKNSSVIILENGLLCRKWSIFL